MTFSLHAATVPHFDQLLGAVAGLLDKAEAACAAGQLDEKELIETRLAPDMLPFAYQVKSTVTHSQGALEGVRSGRFVPDMGALPDSLAALKTLVGGAQAAVQAASADEVNGWVGRDCYFQFGEYRMDFVGEDFLLSFSLPNFYFHATTTYNILRWKGVALGKRDFMGALRRKR